MDYTDHIAKAFAARKSSHSNVGMQLMFHQLTNSGLAKVIATATTANVTPDIARAAIAKATKAFPVSGSFRVMANTLIPTVVGFVRDPIDVRTLSATEMSSYRVLSSNMLMDDSDSSLWEVQSADEGGNRRLVRKSSDSLGSLLNAACIDSPAAGGLTRKLGKVTASMVTASTSDIHTFGSFVNPFTNTVGYGYFISAGNDEQFERQGHSIEHPVEVVTIPEEAQTASSMSTLVIPSSTVIETVSIGSQEPVFASLATPQNSREALRDYYTKVFSYNPPYFAQLRKIIDSHSFA